MIPIRDRNPSPITPWIVYTVVALNVLVFIGEMGLPDAELRELFFSYGLVPARVTLVLQGEEKLLRGMLLPAFTSMFLHGGFMHLLSNMWFLYIFGDNVEAKLGRTQFVLFYLLCGLIAGALQYLLAPSARIPVVGASGAIAGVLGAYIVSWPKARILTLVPIFYLFTFMQLPAIFVLGAWFFIQLFQGLGSIGASFATGGVAYGAHVGGFIAGIILVKLFPTQNVTRGTYRPPRRSRRRR
ncbi:MAG: rhomboid family intramembrane serine protease [Candidatus Brocadiia bacterium]